MRLRHITPFVILCGMFFPGRTLAQTQAKDSVNEKKKTLALPARLYGPPTNPTIQVSQYIRRMFQDSKGNLWFGTNGDGVARYDYVSLEYFNYNQGFCGGAVRGMIEDEDGDIWFATSGGVCRYDHTRAVHPCNTSSCAHDLRIPVQRTEHDAELAKAFHNYTVVDGLAHPQVWCIMRDKNGNLWFGTEGGVSCYDGKSFTPFPIPAVDLSNFPNAYPAPKLINCIVQDRSGKIWFGSNGGGVYCYDPSTAPRINVKPLLNFSEKDGLCNNFVQCVFEDKQGDLWFGTRFGGLSRCRSLDKNMETISFTNLTFNFKVLEGLSKNFAWTMLQDKKDRFWIATAGGGLYSYDGKDTLSGDLGANGGKTFNYGEAEGLPNRFVQSLLIDKQTNFWVGTSGGLFLYDGKGFVNVTKVGPWPKKS